MNPDLLQKLQAIYEKEQASSFVARTADQLPRSYESITDDWLTDVLCTKGSGAKVAGHRLGEADEGTSNRRLIVIEYNQAGRDQGLPGRVYCKASYGLANRIALGLSGGAWSEIVFYRDIRRHLDIEAPQAYYTEIDRESLNSLIMLEDIGERGSDFCSDKTPMTLPRAQSQMRLLAKVHGTVYASEALQRAILQLPTWPEFFEKTLSFGMREGACQGFLDAEEVIPGALYRRSHEVWAATVSAVDDHLGARHTLAHGDVHLKNWYLAGDGEMGLADWQCCSRGHWGRDVAYTISTALQPEDRRLWERDLLKLYFEELAAAGGPVVAFDSGFGVYRQQLLAALAWWTFTLSPPPGMPDMQPRDTTLEFVRRISTAIHDLEALDAFA